jgi:hypothetical protein
MKFIILYSFEEALPYYAANVEPKKTSEPGSSSSSQTVVPPDAPIGERKTGSDEIEKEKGKGKEIVEESERK